MRRSHSDGPRSSAARSTKRRDGFVEDDAAGGNCGLGSLCVGERGQLAAGGKGDVIDLGEIVIFAGEPEDGGVGMACSSGLARAGDGGGGFERGIKRTAKQADLLACENGACSLGEGSERIFGGCRRVLFGHEMDELWPVRVGGAEVLARFRPVAKRHGAIRHKSRERGGSGPALRLLDNNRLSRIRSLVARLGWSKSGGAEIWNLVLC